MRAHETFGRYLRQTRTGRLVIDRARVHRDAKLDGKFLVSSSDDFLPDVGRHRTAHGEVWQVRPLRTEQIR